MARGRNISVLAGTVVALTLLFLLGGMILEGRETSAQDADDPVLVGAGDIARCDGRDDEATAALLDDIGGTVFTLGDNVSVHGTTAEFRDCYDPSWGRHLGRTMPATGNHEYETPSASGYFGYFGGKAGDPEKGYYSYDRGAWHIVVLNSNCSYVKGGCGSGSPQEQWLRADLASHPAACTAAYFHHPRFSSGPNGDAAVVKPFWETLHEAGADVVLNGHDHVYERFAPQDPDGVSDSSGGIRQFTVGTGGSRLAAFREPKPNSEVRIPDTNGVLKLTLHPDGYDWQFVTAPSGAVADSGNARCSGATPSPPDTMPPTVQRPQQEFPASSVIGASAVPTNLVWSAEDKGSGVAGYELERSAEGGAPGTYRSVTLSSKTSTSETLPLDPGVAYQFRVRAVDDAGNVSDWAYGQAFSVDAKQENSESVTYTRTWRSQVADWYYGGARYYADASGSVARFDFANSSSVAWVTSTGLNRGRAEVWLDGEQVDTIDLYSGTWQPREVVFAQNGLDRSVRHTLEIRALGAKSFSSSGTRVHVDGFLTLE